MADEMHVHGKDLKDLKVVELKKELSERGLTITGNKSDLVARLEDYFLKQGDETEEIEVEGVFDSEIEQLGAEFDQEIGEELDRFDEQEGSSGPESKNEQSDEKADIQTENIPPSVVKPVKIQLNLTDKAAEEPKKVALGSTKTETERRADRQERFGIPLNEKQKKQARAERFGVGEKHKTGSSQKLSLESTKNAVDPDKLSKRAERFGAVSPYVTKTAEEERIKKRKERFGIPTSGLSTDSEERKKMRAERFKQA